MRIERIDRTLAVCKSHLELTNSFNTEIDILLAGIVLVIAYAEFESLVGEAIDEKLETMDLPTDAYNAKDNLKKEWYRGILSSGLADFLGHFGDRYKSDFNLKGSQRQRAVTFYNNIITNRHNLAHKSGSSITFREVEAFYDEGHIVLDFFHDALFTRMSINPSMQG